MKISHKEPILRLLQRLLLPSHSQNKKPFFAIKVVARDIG
jgi:hypothetical protein